MTTAEKKQLIIDTLESMPADSIAIDAKQAFLTELSSMDDSQIEAFFDSLIAEAEAEIEYKQSIVQEMREKFAREGIVVSVLLKKLKQYGVSEDAQAKVIANLMEASDQDILHFSKLEEKDGK